MPTFRHGRGTRVFVDEEELSAYFREATISVTVDTAETSAFGTFDKTYVVGMIGGSASLSGMFEGSADGVDAELSAILGVDAASVLTVMPEGASVIGRRCSLISVRETTYEVSAPISDVVAVSAEFQATSMLRSGVNLHIADTAETATGNSTSVDNAASSAQGGAAHLHVFSNSRNGTLIAKVQHSTNDSVWNDLVTFATVGSTTKSQERVEVARGTTVDRYLRGQWTIAGSTGSILFVIAFARNLV